MLLTGIMQSQCASCSVAAAGDATSPFVNFAGSAGHVSGRCELPS